MIMTTGVVKNRQTHKDEAYMISMLKKTDLNQVMSLQELVYNNLPNKDVLATDTMDFIEGCIQDDGFIIGVHNSKNQLISYRMISLPNNRNDNMGIDLKLPQKELSQVAHLETTVVHPNYRGNGLQSKSLQLALPLLESKQIKHVICTVSPFNLFSLTNIMKNGLKIKVLTRKYGQAEDNSDGLWRFILHRDMEALTLAENLKGIRVGLEEFSIQKILLDKGFIGDALSADGRILSYVK
jgi:hypothetical protein